MAAPTRNEWNDATAERLAQTVGTLAGTREPEPACAFALEQALELTGAVGGEVVTLDETGVMAPRVRRGAERGELAPVVTELVSAGKVLGRLIVWGEGAAGHPALRVVGIQLGQVLGALWMERHVAAQRDRNRRFAQALRALRDVHPTEQAVMRMLEEARGLVNGAAAALVTGLPGDPGPTVSLGLEPAHERELGVLMSGEPAAALDAGTGWAGPVAPGSALRGAGLMGWAVVPVGQPQERIGALVAVTRNPRGLAPEDLDLLVGLADHATTALGAAALRERLDDLATVDASTRFFNARYFTTRLEQEAHRALRNGDSLSLLVVGIDGYDQLRGMAGATEAEKAVSALAEFMVPRLRATDIGCRTAPDELAVILPSAAGLDAYLVGERIRAGFQPEGALGWGVSLSLGVATFPDPAGTADQLDGFAHAALGFARRSGGDRVFLYDREVAQSLEAEQTRERAVEDSLLTTISALAVAVDERHATTRGHSQHVARVAALLAAELGMPGDRVEDVRLAGLLHDVGKIGVTDELLVRPGPLTAGEWEEVRQHPEIGYRMLSAPRLQDVRVWVRHHHECPDGTGYPLGLTGAEIPLESAVIAVANALDTMTCARPYRMGVPFEDAVAEIASAAGTRFDERVVDALLRLVARGETGLRPESDDEE